MTCPPLRSHPRTGLVMAVAAVCLLGACGVDIDDSASGLGTGPGATTSTTIECEPGETGGDGSTGGTIGSDGADPNCTPGTTTGTEPDATTTTSEPETTTTTETEDDEDAYVESMNEALRKSEAIGFPITTDVAECAAPTWVDILGVDNLIDAGVEPEDLVGKDISEEIQSIIDRSDATELVEALVDCGFDVDTTIIGGIAEEGGLTDEQADCFADALPDGFATKLLAVSIAEGTDGLDADPDLADTIKLAAAGCS